MKKFLLAGFVVATFIIYSIRQHGGNSDAPIIAPPVSQNNTTQSPSNPTASSGSGSNAGTPTPAATAYKDGQYTGTAADAYYGYIQVKAIISGGKITDVQFLQAPNDRSTSVSINSQADPYLRQEAIQAQSAQVDTI